MNYLRSEGSANQRLPYANIAPTAHGEGWKTQLITVYQQQQPSEASALQATLAQRVRALTGREMNVDAIWVDLDQRAAFVTVDGVRFRWQQSQLVMLRPCALCGSGEFASQPLISRADVGYALSTWQPHHQQCQLGDPANWLNA
jgi:hypothetical protein